MSKFYEISDDVVKKFNSILNTKAIPVQIDFAFVGSEKQKQLIKVSKLQDFLEFLLSKQLLVSINEDLYSAFDEESINILFEQEIDKITVDMKTGNIKLVKPDLSTFSGIINKWGVEKVARANQISDLYIQQRADGVEEVIFDL